MNLLIGQNEALPNVTGDFTFRGGGYVPNGPFELVGGSYSTMLESGAFNNIIRLNLSKGNPIYKNNAHVQPRNISCKCWLRLA